MNRIDFAIVRAAFALVAGLALTIGVAQAETLYKYLGPDGKVVYSDKPPPKGTKFETLTPDTKPTGVDLRSSGTAIGDADDARQKRVLREQEHQTHIDTAKRNYEAAVAALEAAKEPQEGERTQNAN